jgi:peptide chain release factor 2
LFQKWSSSGGRFDVDRKKERLVEISKYESMDGFWDDTENAAKIQKEKNLLKNVVETYTSLDGLREEFEILSAYIKEGDEDSLFEANQVFERYKTKLLETEKKALLSEEMDGNNAIISINSGAGGTESCDWAFMLYRMLIKWCEGQGYVLKLMDQQQGDTAGIKSVTFVAEGAFAYGFLKSETGVHRLVRISPFDSNGRRHTSFASIYVSPEIDDTIEIEILDKDLKIDVYRAGGAGGQSVNTTDSAVRITHLPTNTVVTCQNERSQVQNKLQAMKVLRSRLYEQEMEKRRAKEKIAEDAKAEIGWGSQIRSYVLHPYKLVKDHRTGYEVSTAEKVLEGDLDDFIDAYLRFRVGGQKVSE